MSVTVLENVSLSLGGKVIVEELGLRLADGDRVGLIGPNGSGKTSLLRLISGDQAPDGGVIRSRKHARIGYLPQEHSVFRKLTTEENILAVLEAAGSRDRAEMKKIADPHLHEFPGYT